MDVLTLLVKITTHKKKNIDILVARVHLKLH